MKTLFEKIWEKHVVKVLDDGTTILFIDRHLIHEVTSPQAFEGLRLSQVSEPPAAGRNADARAPCRP